MIGITNAGGGKDRYRVKVFGGTSAPANPKEGYIWVKTSTPISGYEINCWTNYIPGYSMNNGFTYIYGKPEWEANVVNIIDDKVGLVYFNFNKCMQQQGSTWHTMDAFVFHNGSWMQFSTSWNGELFYQGNQYTEHTGGWTGMVRNPNVSTNVADPANPNLFSDANADPVGTALFRTVNKVDMTNYRTLKWTGWGFGSNSGGQYGANCTVHNNPSTDNGVISDVTFQAESTYSMDISGISGAHYITFRAWGSRGQRISISKVWME